MFDEDDEELASLLADEDRVRDVLLAAVDGQLAPPARTDLAQIVQRGKRRARVQVLAASAAAVVLIAAVALGATALAKWNGSNDVSSAGPGTALPVSQTITTTPNPPSTTAKDASQATCVYPGLATGAQKWVSLNAKQAETFESAIAEFAGGPMTPVQPAVSQQLMAQGGQGSARSVEIYAHGQLDLVTVSATAYSGTATINAAIDAKQESMPAACTGTFTQRPLGKSPLVNQYTVATTRGLPGRYDYLRVQVYDASGIRYDVTEVVNAAGLPDYLSSKLVPSSTDQATAPVTVNVPPAIGATELAEIALQVASLG